MNYEYKYADELRKTARALVAPGKGILASDESTGTIAKRLASVHVENTRENRRAYRYLLYTSKGASQYISGAILYEETLFETTEDGKKFSDLLREAGIIIGIKTDMGTVTLPGTNGETATQGLTDLGKRCQRYYAEGARFCKWRAVLKIGGNCPSQLAIQETAHTLARYAAISQENGLAPIVEPEILVDGDHDISVCQYWTEKVLAAVYKALNDHHVLLEGTLLKPNMVLHGQDCKRKRDPMEVGLRTVTALQRTVPAAVPGIVFLSGGQTEEEATVNLNAINVVDCGPKPWRLSFSFGRALQDSCQKAWSGKPSNVAAGQEAFLKRAKANSDATQGKYTGWAADEASKKSLYEKGYIY